MELVYARSSKQPGGLLKHRDKRLLMPSSFEHDRRRRPRRDLLAAGPRDTLASKRSSPCRRVIIASRTRPPSSRRCGVVWRSACYTATPKGSKAEARIALLAPPSRSRRRVLRVVRCLSEAGRRHGAQGRMDTDGARAALWVWQEPRIHADRAARLAVTVVRRGVVARQCRREPRAARPVALPRVSCRGTHGPTHGKIII